jgi:hypothetical protein
MMPENALTLDITAFIQRTEAILVVLMRNANVLVMN